jgi:hypothetical protein
MIEHGIDGTYRRAPSKCRCYVEQWAPHALVDSFLVFVDP